METGPVWVAVGATTVGELAAYGVWSWGEKRATLCLVIVLGVILSFLMGFTLGTVFGFVNTAYIVGLTMMSVAGGFVFLLSQVDQYKAVFTAVAMVSGSLFFSGFLMIARGDQFGPTALIGSMILGHFIGVLVSFVNSLHIKGEEWKKTRPIFFTGLVVMVILILADLFARRYFVSLLAMTFAVFWGFLYLWQRRSIRPRWARIMGLIALLGLAGYLYMVLLH